MWISKTEWELMKDRVARLERDVHENSQFKFYPSNYSQWSQSVPIKELLKILLDHLHLNLTYTPTTGSYYSLKDKS